MSEICTNRLRITGSEDELLAFIRALDMAEANSPSLLERFDPRPEVMTQNETYKWIDDHLGSGTSADFNTVLNHTATLIDIFFNTTMGPCELLVKNIAKQFPELLFHYRFCVEGFLYRGYYIYAGEKYEQEFTEVLGDDDFWDMEDFLSNFN